MIDELGDRAIAVMALARREAMQREDPLMPPAHVLVEPAIPQQAIFQVASQRPHPSGRFRDGASVRGLYLARLSQDSPNFPRYLRSRSASLTVARREWEAANTVTVRRN